MKKLICVFCLLFSGLISSQCWLQIDAGENYNLGIKLDGTLWAWGFNSNGQLGTGNTWYGQNGPIQIGTDSNWLKVSAGGTHSLAIKSNGTLWAWGDNQYGQLGDGTIITRSTPVQIGTATNWLAVEASLFLSLALKTDGTLWSWGANNSGQLGLGNYTNKTTPTQVGIESNWSSISSKGSTCAAMKNNGSIWSWGQNIYGELGDGTNVGKPSPMQIGISSTWQSVDMADYSILAIRTDGTLWSAGWNVNGQLGLGYTGGAVYNLTQVGTDNDWHKVYGGYRYIKGIKNDGSMWAWGSNTHRVFGDTTIQSSNTPLLISSEFWTFIATGRGHSIHIKNDGSLLVCGGNLQGELGIGFSGIASIMLIPVSCPGELGTIQNEVVKYKIYPNPTNDIISIVGERSNEINAIEILDMSGKKILTSKNTTINLEKVSVGVYIMQISSDNSIERYKFIKQ